MPGAINPETILSTELFHPWVCGLAVRGALSDTHRHAQGETMVPERREMSGPADIRTRFFPPPECLADCITSIHLLEIETADAAPIEDALQLELANIRIVRGATPEIRIGDASRVKGLDTIVSGPTSHPIHFALRPTRLWGVGIKPCGWARLAHGSAHEIANLAVDGGAQSYFPGLSTLVAALHAELPDDEREARLLADYLLSLDNPSAETRAVVAVQQALLDVSIRTVEQLADTANLHVRSLERIALRYFGFPPKLLLRRQRLMRVLSQYLVNGAAAWSEVLDPQYTDHAQFTREFRHFMGVSPSEYAKFELPLMRAFVKARAKQFGSPVQVLDKS